MRIDKMNGPKDEKRKWYEHPAFMWFWLIVFWPLGMLLLYWDRNHHSKWKKIAGITFIIWIVIMAFPKDQEKTSPQSQSVTTQQQVQEEKVIQKQSIPATVPTSPPNVKPVTKNNIKNAPPAATTGEHGPNGETIKGNINKRGEKIYHMPGSLSYSKTIPEAWFSTPAEAEAAGYRPSRK